MDISKFVLSGRETAKINGNWASYRKQLSKRIYNLRKKLGIATINRAKYSSKIVIKADDLAQNHEYIPRIIGNLFLSTNLNSDLATCFYSSVNVPGLMLCLCEKFTRQRKMA